MARDAYTYLHVVLVAGVIVAAVGDELVIAHPDRGARRPEVAAVVAGPAIYLLAHVVFRLRLTGTVSAKRLGGAVACVAARRRRPASRPWSWPRWSSRVLVAVIGAEELAGRRRAARGEPAPLEALEASLSTGPSVVGSARAPPPGRHPRPACSTSTGC